MQVIQSGEHALLQRVERFAVVLQFLQGYGDYIKPKMAAKLSQIQTEGRADVRSSVTAQGLLAAQRRREDRITALKLEIDFRVRMHHQACEVAQQYSDSTSEFLLEMMEANLSFLKDPL